MYVDKLTKIITEVCPSVVKYTGCHYVSDGILESIEIMEIVAEIEEVFDIMIAPQYIVPEYFESIETLEKMIQDVKKATKG